MSELLNEKVKDLSEQCSKGLDQIIFDAVKLRTGKDLTLVDLKGRMQRHKYEDSPIEEFTLDGEPLLQIHPIKVEERRDGNRIKLVATQPFRYLA